MAGITKQIRFCGNNFVTSSATTTTVSSAATLYPASNLQLTERYKHWAPTGQFELSGNRNNRQISVDGSNFYLTQETFLTGTALAASIQAQIISHFGGGAWVCTYNSNSTFTISYSGTFTLNVGTNTGHIWDTIGFTGGSDLTGASTYTSDSVRIHTDETVDWDLGADTTTAFFSMIAKRDGEFTLSSSAVLTLEGDSIPIGSSPAFIRTLTRGSEGVFEFLDDATDNTYRYWKLTIQDRENPLGSAGIRVGVIYLGDYITLSSRGVESGFQKTQIDPSLKNTSESGATYYKIKNRYTRFSNLSMPYLEATDRKAIEDFFYDHGNFKPFFISIDPSLAASTELQELTKYVKFDGDPTVTHIKTDTYSVQFNAREDL